MRRSWLALGALGMAAASDWSQSPAFDHFYNLRYDEALAALEQQLRRDARDPGVHNFLAYTILYRRLFLAGALTSSLALDISGFRDRGKVAFPPDEEQRFAAAVRRSQEITAARLRMNPRDAEALYAAGVAEVHRASYAWLIRKDWRGALGSGTASRRFHQRALEADPGFMDASLVPAVHDYIVGSLPLWAKPLAFLAGFRGDKSAGLRGIERVAAEGKSVRVEACVILAMFLAREKQHGRAAEILGRLAAEFPGNFLYRIELIRLLLVTGDTAGAARELAVLEAHARPEGRYAALAPVKLLPLRADVEMANRRFDAALGTLARLDSLAAGNAEITAQAWVRRGRVHDLKGNRTEALAAYRAAIRTAPNSEAASEARKLLDRPHRLPGG